MVAAGCCYPLSFAPIDIWPLAFLSVIVLLLAIVSKTSVLSPFKLGFYWGLGAFGVGASWVFVSIHEFGFVPVPGAAAITLLFVVILSLYKGLFAFLTHRIASKTQTTLLVFIAPGCWLISEYLQAVIFGGFPWLIVGYSQTDSVLGPLAAWLGVYGVSWFVMLIASCFALILTQKRATIYWQSLLIVGGIVVVSYFHHHGHEDEQQVESLDVGLVQPNIPQEQKWDRRYFSKIIDVLYEESQPLWDADLIVWPEGAIPAYSHQVNDILFNLQNIAEKSNTDLILGIPEYNHQTKQAFVALKSLGQHKQDYYKQVLVPFGEYVPLEKYLRGLIKFLDLPMSGFTPASNSQLPMQFSHSIAIPAICYEIVYPDIIRQLATKSDSDLPQMIVTVSNDAWFGDSFGPYQHMQMARMRSLELGIPLIRSTNDGITAVVDHKGEMLKSMPRYQQGNLRFQLKLINRDTFYRQYGSSGILVLLIISAVCIIWSGYQNSVKN